MKRRLRGFTLLEVLVVLTILGVMLGLVAVNYGMDERQRLVEDGRRLALLLEHASVEARLTGRPLAWAASGQGYAFFRRSADDRGWQALGAGEILRERRLPAGERIADVRIEGMSAGAGEMIVFSPSGVNPAFSLLLVSEGDSVRVAGNVLGQIVAEPAHGG